MKKTTHYIAILIGLTLLAMPAKVHAGDTSLWGTTFGAALGGYVGSTIGKGRGNLAATAFGTLVGAGFGNSIGRSFDRRTYYAPAPQHVYYAPVYRPYRPNYVAPISVPHHNQNKNYHSRTTNSPAPHAMHVEKGYMGQYPHNQRHKGRHCREFTQTIRLNGQLHESYGIACLRPDGSWQIQN